MRKMKLPKIAILVFVISGLIMLLVKMFGKNQPGKLVSLPRSMDELNSMPIVEQPVLVPVGALGNLLEQTGATVVNNPAVGFIEKPIPVTLIGDGNGGAIPAAANPVPGFAAGEPVYPAADYISPGVVNPDRVREPLFVKVYGDGSVGAVNNQRYEL